jgi:hypothetical protein
MQQTNSQLAWADIPDDYYIRRFNLEISGRSYAVNYLEDPITDVYRRIYLAYCKGREWDIFYVPNGTEVVETGVFESDIKAAEEEIEKRRNGFYNVGIVPIPSADGAIGATRAYPTPYDPLKLATVIPK